MSELRDLTIAVPRSQGGSRGGSPATIPLALRVQFNPTQTSAALTTGDGKAATLPAGAIVIGALSLGGGTGGASPTVNIGTAADPNGFLGELPADAIAVSLDGALLGVLAGAALAADTPLYGGVGASAATGGTTTAWVLYLPNDDGSA